MRVKGRVVLPILASTEVRLFVPGGYLSTKFGIVQLATASKVVDLSVGCPFLLVLFLI